MSDKKHLHLSGNIIYIYSIFTKDTELRRNIYFSLQFLESECLLISSECINIPYKY